MLQWKLQFLLSKLIPNDTSVSYTLRIFGLLLLFCLAAFLLGAWRKWRRIMNASTAVALSVLLIWGALYATRPAWLRIATQPVVPMPTASAPKWETRSPGLEAAELEMRVNDVVVDRMVLVRLDQQRFKFSVHWDTNASRTAEDWQRELHAAVVVNGSYFGGRDHAPLTPLRLSGTPAGPTSYESSHGAFVSDGKRVEIIDLNQQDVFKIIGGYPEAMVSYPLLLDAKGDNRAPDNKEWLASRNFIGLDTQNRVVLGTTETGFFTLHRLGEFLKSAPLGLKTVLNFDGGPLVSQVVRAGEFKRVFHGTAEMTNGNDVLRAFWHSHFEKPWTLPVVLVAEPVSNEHH